MCAFGTDAFHDRYVLAHKCRDCALGTENSAGDDAAGSKTECAHIYCDKNYYVSVFHTCEPCVVGTTRYAGDDASMSATQCNLCSEVRVVRFVCRSHSLFASAGD